MHIILATQKDFINPTTDDWYVEQIIQEDMLLSSALKKCGFQVGRRAWDDSTDWSDANVVVIRATWNYSSQVNKFKSWLELVTSECTLLNPISTVFDNMDKRYLKDLERNGITIPNTQFISENDGHSLHEWISKLGWDEVVLKPTVSAGGRHTYRIGINEADNHSALYAKLIAKEAMMIQEYQRNITTKGEITLVCFDGKFSHAIRKYAKDGEFRVQDDFGGSVEEYLPTDDEIVLAERAMQCISPTPVYGRVDMMWNNQGELCVSELELIEPELWLRYNKDAAGAFAKSITRSIIG